MDESQQDQINQVDDFTNSNNFDYDKKVLNEIENWRGKGCAKNEDEPSKSKDTYLTPLPEWDLFPNKQINTPILKNGSICKAVLIDIQHITVEETCAFDALLQIFLYSIAIQNNYGENAHGENLFINLASCLTKSGKVTSKLKGL